MWRTSLRITPLLPFLLTLKDLQPPMQYCLELTERTRRSPQHQEPEPLSLHLESLASPWGKVALSRQFQASVVVNHVISTCRGEEYAQKHREQWTQKKKNQNLVYLVSIPFYNDSGTSTKISKILSHPKSSFTRHSWEKAGYSKYSLMGVQVSRSYRAVTAMHRAHITPMYTTQLARSQPRKGQESARDAPFPTVSQYPRPVKLGKPTEKLCSLSSPLQKPDLLSHNSGDTLTVRRKGLRLRDTTLYLTAC